MVTSLVHLFMSRDPKTEMQSRPDRALIIYLSLIGFFAGFLLALAVTGVFILSVRDPEGRNTG